MGSVAGARKTAGDLVPVPVFRRADLYHGLLDKQDCLSHCLGGIESPSGQRLGDHLSCNVRQAEITTEVAVGQARVIESEQMQNRGV